MIILFTITFIIYPSGKQVLFNLYEYFPQNDFVYWHECVFPHSTLEVPGPTSNSKLLVLESILELRTRHITTIALTKHYFHKTSNHVWLQNQAPDVYKKLPDELVIPSEYTLVCIFVTHSGIVRSLVEHITEIGTQDENTEKSAHVMRCKIPEEVDLRCSKIFYRLTQGSDLEKVCNPKMDICADLFVNTKTRIRNNMTNTNLPISKDSNKPRETFLLCTEPIYTKVPFIAEYVAHYLNLGAPRIYISYNFQEDPEGHYKWLRTLLDSYIRSGHVILWGFNMPPFLLESDHFKQQWTHGALYFMKDIAEYIMMNDPDEFLVISPKFPSIQKAILSVKEDYCWQAVPSFRMWKEYNPDAPWLLERFWGREEDQLWHWTKLFWKVDNLWYGGFHHGGACTLNGRNWEVKVNDWITNEDPHLVYRWNHENVRLLHFYNVFRGRIGYGKKMRPPWFPLKNDTDLLERYLPKIQSELKRRGIPASWPRLPPDKE